MTEVSVYEARNRLSALIEQVERGGEVTITRRGKVVAKLVGAGRPAMSAGAAEQLFALRRQIAGRGETFSAADRRAFRDEGRR